MPLARLLACALAGMFKHLLSACCRYDPAAGRAYGARTSFPAVCAARFVLRRRHCAPGERAKKEKGAVCALAAHAAAGAAHEGRRDMAEEEKKKRREEEREEERRKERRGERGVVGATRRQAAWPSFFFFFFAFCIFIFSLLTLFVYVDNVMNIRRGHEQARRNGEKGDVTANLFSPFCWRWGLNRRK